MFASVPRGLSRYRSAMAIMFLYGWHKSRLIPSPGKVTEARTLSDSLLSPAAEIRQ